MSRKPLFAFDVGIDAGRRLAVAGSVAKFGFVLVVRSLFGFVEVATVLLR